MEIATPTLACVGCSKSLIDVQKPPICTNCKTVYCTAKCKKAHAKVHKKTCKWIPNEDNSYNYRMTPHSHECGDDDCHDHHAPAPTRTPTESAKFLHINGKIPIKTARGLKWMEIEPKLQPIIYPEGLSNGRVDIITMADGSVTPCMSDKQATHLFGTLYERNATKLSALIPAVDNAKSTGYLEAEYESAIDFATAYLNNRVTEFKWIDTTVNNVNNANNVNTRLHPSVLSAISTMDKNGRQGNVLFGRVRIQGANSRDYAVSACTRLDRIQLVPSNNL